MAGKVLTALSAEAEEEGTAAEAEVAQAAAGKAEVDIAVAEEVLAVEAALTTTHQTLISMELLAGTCQDFLH